MEGDLAKPQSYRRPKPTQQRRIRFSRPLDLHVAVHALPGTCRSNQPNAWFAQLRIHFGKPIVSQNLTKRVEKTEMRIILIAPCCETVSSKIESSIGHPKHVGLEIHNHVQNPIELAISFEAFTNYKKVMIQARLELAVRLKKALRGFLSVLRPEEITDTDLIHMVEVVCPISHPRPRTNLRV